MQTQKISSAEKTKNNAANGDKKSAVSETVQPAQLNPLWHSMATSIGGRAAAAGSTDPPPIQTKLTVGAQDDEYEKEADTVADRVMRMPLAGGGANHNSSSAYYSRSSGGLGFSYLQRKTGASASQPSVPHSVKSTIESPGSGSPLSKSVRTRIETVLGANLSGVRVHSGTAAQDASRHINAKAFTHKNNIFLGSGQSAGDVFLMAHESAHVIQQSGNVIRRVPGEDEDLLPTRRRVTWGKDQFSIAFTRIESRTLRITTQYVGPHNMVGSRAGQFDVSISSRILNTHLRPGSGNELVLDLYNDGNHIVRLQDEIRYLPTASSPARNHVITLRVDGEFRQSSPFVIEDPGASSSDAQPFVPEFLPGIRPVFKGAVNPVNHKLELKARVDADGDRMPELGLTFQADSFMSWANAMASRENVRLYMRQLNNPSANQLYADFVVSAPSTAHSGRHDLLSPTPANAPRLAFDVTRMADGRQPMIIDLTNPHSSEKLRIFPPSTENNQTVYQVSKGQQTVDYRFPLERGAIQNVIEAERHGALGYVKFWDTRLSRYGDRFRLMIDPGTGSRTLFAVAPLGPTGQPYGGSAVPINVSGTFNSIHLLEDGATSLTFDFNGDNISDLNLHDRLEAQEGVSPEHERRHVISLSGPSVGQGRRYTLEFIASPGWIRAEGPRSADDDRAHDTAMAVYGLQQSQALGGIDDQRRWVEQIISAFRRRALDNHWITQRLFDAWDNAERSMIQLEGQMGGHVDRALGSQAAANVRAMYNALKADTPREQSLSVSPYTWENPYTGESTVRTPYTNIASEGPGDRAANDLASGRWSSGLRNYHRMRAGLDAWIMKQATDAGTSSHELNLLRAQAAMLSQLNILKGKGAHRIHAVFRPSEKYSDEVGYQEQVPLEMYYWREGDTWFLLDITNPSHPFRDSVQAAGTDFESIARLMSELDNGDHFCEGHIYYEVPGLATGQVPVQDHVTWRDFFTWLGIGLAIVGTILSFGTGAVAVAGTWALVGSALAGGTVAVLDIVERERHGTTTAASFILDLAQIVASIAGIGALAAGRVLSVARASAAASAPLTGSRWAALALTAQKYVIPLAATSLTADAVTLAVLTSEAARQLDAIESGSGSSSAKRDAKLRLLGQLALTGGLTALSLRGNVAEIRMGRSIEVINVGGEPVVVPVGTSIGGAAVARSMTALEGASDDAARATAETRLLHDMRSHIGGPGGEQLAHTEELVLATRSGGADATISLAADGSLTRAGVGAGNLNDLADQVAQANNAARAHGLEFEYVLEVRSGSTPGSQEVRVTRRARTRGGMATDPRRLYVDVDARVRAQTTQLERLRRAAGHTPFRIQASPDGGISLNGQIDIHPSRLADIDSADLPSLMSSTRALDEAGGDINRLRSRNRVAAERIEKFQSGSEKPHKSGYPSRGYRLQFHFTHANTLAYIDTLLADIGTSRAAEPAFQDMSQLYIDRLRNVVTMGVPSGTANAKQQAARYALNQHPANAAEFVQHFEFYISEMKVRIASEVDHLAAAGTSVNKRARSRIGTEVEASMADPTNPRLPSSTTVTEVRATYDRLGAQIGGRLGVSHIDARLRGVDQVDAIRALPSVRFSSEPTAIYHTQKHYRELPPSRQVPPEFDAYFQAAQDTIKNPGQLAQDVAASSSQRGGMRTYVFTKVEEGVSMSAYVMVSDDGVVFLATLIPN